MARILTVSPEQHGAFRMIGDALNTAVDGDIVSVTPGTYYEALFVNGRHVEIEAAGGPGTVIIDVSTSTYPVLSGTGGEIHLRNLHLRAGDAPAVTIDRGRLVMAGCEVSAAFGAAINVGSGAEFELSKCRVTGGRYGLVVEDATGSADGCEFADISEDGVIVRLGASPVLRNCTITRCGLRGIYVYQSARPVIESCDISHTGDAGIVVVAFSSPTVSHCRIHDVRGPAVSFARGCKGSVDGCVTSNTAEPAIAVADGATPTIVTAKPPAGRSYGVDAAQAANTHDSEKVGELLARLDALVGLAGVKDEVRALIDEIQVNEWRRTAGLPVGGISYHLIFAGAPGTGKTTVARIYGELLSALGVLPGGPFREVARRELVGELLGETTQKTARAVEAAMGGVLFIDEAYTLSRSFGGSTDFGQEAIDTLVKMMEDHRHSIAVIAAGYTGEMTRFLATNPGLASRFAKTVEFDSYSDEELLLIAQRTAETDGYDLSGDLPGALYRHFAAMPRDENFGNAREVRKLFERLRKAQARRLRAIGGRPTLADLRTITVDDLRATAG